MTCIVFALTGWIADDIMAISLPLKSHNVAVAEDAHQFKQEVLDVSR